MSFQSALQGVLADPLVLLAWAVLVAVSLAVLSWDLRLSNWRLPSLMKWVWGLTVLYSGPIGLAIYWCSGRRQIPRDSIWRRAWRSVSHCYSGCGIGEVTGLVVGFGLLAMGEVATAALSFALAYLFGFALTVGPLMQDGVGLKEAFVDAVSAETLSIGAMEIAAIGTDLWLVGGADPGHVLFWTSLAVSLSVGVVAAYPVNVVLLALGVKGGMSNPREQPSTPA